MMTWGTMMFKGKESKHPVCDFKVEDVNETIGMAMTIAEKHPMKEFTREFLSELAVGTAVTILQEPSMHLPTDLLYRVKTLPKNKGPDDVTVRTVFQEKFRRKSRFRRNSHAGAPIEHKQTYPKVPFEQFRGLR